MISRQERRKLERKGLPIEPEQVELKYEFKDYFWLTFVMLPVIIGGFFTIVSAESYRGNVSIEDQLKETRTTHSSIRSAETTSAPKSEYQGTKTTSQGDSSLLTGDFVGSVEAGNNKNIDFEYDGNGNLIKDNNFTYTYNAFNQLVTVKNIKNDSLVVSYDYDAHGMMILRDTPDVKTLYVYSPFNKQLISSTSTYLPSQRKETRDYIYGSQGIDDPIQMVLENGKTYLFTKDVQGSIRTVTDASGKVVEQYSYSAYGETKIYNGKGAEISSSQIGNEFMFTGQRWDDAIKKYYYKARFYDPYVARFIQVDPSGYVDSHNPYNYVANDPINNVDPTGKILANIVGAGTSVATNAAIAKAFGQQYSAIDALIDGSLGFATGGLAATGQLKNLKKISDLQKSALNMGMNTAHVGLDVAADYAHFQNKTSKSGGLPDEQFSLEESVLYSVIGSPIAGTSKIDNQLGGVSDWFGTRKKATDALQAIGKLDTKFIYDNMPSSWVSKASKKNEGIIFYPNPSNTHNSVRIMPGNPNSPNPSQHVDYVIVSKNGKNLDTNWNPVVLESPEAHIPLSKFNFSNLENIYK